MSKAQKIEFYKRRPFSDKLNAVIGFIRQGGWSYIKAQLFITGPVLLLVNILVVQSAQNIFSFQSMQNPEQLLSDMINSYGVAIVISLISTALLPAVTYGYMRVYENTPMGEIQINQVWQKAIRKFPSILGFIIIFAIITGLAAFITVLMFSILGALGAILGALLSILVMVAVMNTFSLGLPAIAFEDKDPITAFARSVKLINGKWFSTLGILVVTVLISFLINMVFGIPRSVMYMVWAMNSLDTATGTFSGGDMPQYMQILDVVFAVISTFGTLVAYSLVYLGLGFQFFNLVERQESRGLMAEIQGLENQESTEEEGETY